MAGLFALVRLLTVVALGYVVWRHIRRYLTGPSGSGAARPRPSAAAGRLEQCPVCRDYLPATGGNCGKPGCPRPGPAAFAGVLVAGLLLLAGPAQAESGGRYLVDLAGSNISANLTVNGIMVERWQISGTESAGVSLNHWLRPGNNSVSVTARPLRDGGATRIHLRIYFLAVATGQVTSLLDLTDLAKLPHGGQISFNLPSAPRLALWQSMPGGVPTAGQALDLLSELRRQAADGLHDGAQWEDLPAFANERADLARAFGVTATSHPLAQTGQKREDNIQLSPQPQADQLDIRPVGNSPLVRLARRDGRPLLAVRSPGGVSMVQALIIGQLEGRWQVLRHAY